MRKLSFLAVAIAAVLFAACGGKKAAQTTEEQAAEKSFEQEQLEASIKQNFDSLAAEVAKLKQLPITEKNGKIVLTEEERQVKPDYLLNPAVAESATGLSDKYRVLSALQVDCEIAKLYDMSTQDYDSQIAKLLVDINDPSFEVMNESSNIVEGSQVLYDAMNQNGRINYYWQIVASALVEQLYIISHDTDKFLTAFDDETASNVSIRIIIIQEAIKRLAEYDPELELVAKVLQPLDVINATTVAELKEEIAEAATPIEVARTALVME